MIVLLMKAIGQQFNPLIVSLFCCWFGMAVELELGHGQERESCQIIESGGGIGQSNFGSGGTDFGGTKLPLT